MDSAQAMSDRHHWLRLLQGYFSDQSSAHQGSTNREPGNALTWASRDFEE